MLHAQNSKISEKNEDRFQMLQLKHTSSLANIFANVFHLKHTSPSLDEHVILIGNSCVDMRSAEFLVD